MKSQFRIYIYILPLIALSIITVCSKIIIDNWPIKIENLRWIDFYMTILFSITIVWLIFGEIRTKMVLIIIDKTHIYRTNIFGLTKYNFKDFDGFETSLVISRTGSHQYLYMLKEGKREIIITEFHHKNYYNLKEEINKHVLNLGDKPYSYLKSFKEIIE